MTTAEAVARHFIFLAAQMEEPTPLTHMQVQKLVYYAQGWSLAIDGRPMFPSVIEAWQHGPVVNELYQKLKTHGNLQIPPGEGVEDTSLSSREHKLIGWIWSRYGKYSAGYLRELTHRETPWQSARAGLDSDEASRNPISEQEIRRFFGMQLERERRFNVDAAQFDAAQSDIQAGRTYPFVG